MVKEDVLRIMGEGKIKGHAGLFKEDIIEPYKIDSVKRQDGLIIIMKCFFTKLMGHTIPIT